MLADLLPARRTARFGGQLALLIVVTVCASVTTAEVVASVRMWSHLRAQYTESTGFRTRTIADAAAYPLVSGSPAVLHGIVETARSQRHVRALALYDPFGEPVRDVHGGAVGFDHDPGTVPPEWVGPLVKLALTASRADDPTGGPRPAIYTAPSGDDVHVQVVTSTPLFLPDDDPHQAVITSRQPAPQVVGVVVVRYSDAALRSAQRRQVVVGAVTAAVVAAALLPFALALGRRITRPLRELGEGVRRKPLDPDRFRIDPSDPAEVATLKTALSTALHEAANRHHALDESERRSRAVFESSQDPMLIVTPEGRVAARNPAMARLLPAATQPRGLVDLASTFDPPEVLGDAIRQALEAGFVRVPDAVVPRADAGPRTGTLVVSRLGVDDERLLLISFQDHTEAVAEERRRKGLEDRLRQSQKLEALGVMAAGIAHDFNNQLNVMLGNLLLLREDLGPDHEAAPLLVDLDGATRRCVDLTRGLVTFARRDPEGIALAPFSLVQLVDSTLRLLRPAIPPTVRVDWRPELPLPNVLGAAMQVQQVLMNLCLNARDAMPDGGVLTIAARERVVAADEAGDSPGASPGRYVEMTVRDTGAGMTADVVERIFDPFFTTKESGRGSGLGLSTSFGTVRAHGGWMEVSSAPGVGSCFRVHWPATDLPVEAQSRDDGPVPHGTEALLVAEDEAPLRVLTRLMLERYGYRVVAVADGAEALDALARPGRRFDLVVLDVVMPRLGAEEVVAALRERGDTTPVLLISGNEANRSVQRMAAEHRLPFLAKPYTPIDIARAVRAILDDRTD